MRKFGKIDSNQKQIVKRLREIPGVSIVSIASVGNGTPDIIVGYKNFNYLIELKSSSISKLTEQEIKFIKDWKGNVAVCYNFDQVLQVIGIDE